MTPDDLWWPLVASGGLWWPLMASDGLPHQVMRSMLKVIERLSMHAQQVHQLEFAARALLNAAPKRAFLTWAGRREQVIAAAGGGLARRATRPSRGHLARDV